MLEKIQWWFTRFVPEWLRYYIIVEEAVKCEPKLYPGDKTAHDMMERIRPVRHMTNEVE